MCVSSMSSRAPTKASEPRRHNMPRGRRDCSCRPILLPRACLRTEAGGKTQCAASTNAAHCTDHRSALHRPSHRTASAIAPHCVFLGRVQPSACNPTSRPRFPPSGLAGRPLPVLRHPQSKNEKPWCSNRNTTAFYSLNRAGHYAPDRFLIQNTYFLNELLRSGVTLYSYRRST